MYPIAMYPIAELAARRIVGSYRDPSGHVFTRGDRIFRTVSKNAVPDYEFLRDSGLLAHLEASGQLVGSREVSMKELGLADSSAHYVIEHPKLDLISYPYEWPFAALKQAALFHLKLHMDLLDWGANLSDASAYNVQYRGAQPIFIDLLSLRRYREGEYWNGHRQFCEQFLNPLILRAYCGIPHNAWFRGRSEGISTVDLAALIPGIRKVSLRCFTHIVLPAWFQRPANQNEISAAVPHKGKLPKTALLGMLKQLHTWIGGLEPPRGQRTTWDKYSPTTSYSSDEAKAKAELLAEFTSSAKPRCLLDVGCNNGEQAELALANGAKAVVGIDGDPLACDAAFERARNHKLDLTILQMDLADPSPGQGWLGRERPPVTERIRADALIAMALVHHLAIGRNIPLAWVIDWLIDTASQGVIEFVEKTDPQIMRMLRFRDDIFAEYDLESFRSVVQRRAKIIRETRISDGRVLIWYRREK